MTPQPAPTVGRIVHYHPRLTEVVAPVGGDTIASACAATGPFPAVVTAVWEDGALALLVMRPGRDPLLSCDYVLDGERQGCWSWPPREPAVPEQGPRLEEMSPRLLTVLAQLAEEFGMAGVARSAEALAAAGVGNLFDLQRCVAKGEL